MGAAFRRVGVSILTLQNEKDSARGKKAQGAGDGESQDNQAGKRAGGTIRKGGGKPAGPEVGQALRTVYQRTVEEDIPPEMLDLLGKLG